MEQFFVANSYKDAEILSEPFLNSKGKLYVKVRGKCSRCGGSGHYSYNSKDGTVCYGCGGTGKQIMSVRAYTEKEYNQMQKNNERNRARKIAAKEAKEKDLLDNADQYRHELALKIGFNENEKAYIVCNGDTFAIKEQLKDAGGRYNAALNWYLPEKIDLPAPYKFCEISFSDVFTYIPLTKGFRVKENAEDVVKEKITQIIQPAASKFYPAEPGTRLRDLEVELTSVKGFDGLYGYTFIYTFSVDEYVFVWMTTSGHSELNVGDKVLFTGTIKDFSEYMGINQTRMTRCNIKKI